MLSGFHISKFDGDAYTDVICDPGDEVSLWLFLRQER